MIKKHSFTMVEVIIALGILTIAMFTLVGLLPAGLQNSEETEHSTHAPLVAKTVNNFLALLVNGDDNSTIDGAWNGGNSGDADGYDSWLQNYNLVTENRTNYTTSKDSEAFSTATDLKQGDFSGAAMILPNGGDYTRDPSLKNLTLFKQSNLLYGGYYEDTVDGVVNVQYGIRIWNGQLGMNTTAGQGNAIFTPQASDTGVLFTIEISWPPQMEYQRRIAMGNYYQLVTYVEKH
ncbi:hypothetical protein PQO03_20395 [Lentisphaera profundi]|uniref:Prepilin-type N-terminal cleavage/methylation domain-containing protein n=1 Tax=Lentisphaera profundi TaxID=1658616 RepID=A0ABY7VVC7_9BACT|nr:hypothetical protein [Lentisphaera profundi]WDE98180.1 hypothetical protein PQO03_20395 [Lentisphaera profundi]